MHQVTRLFVRRAVRALMHEGAARSAGRVAVICTALAGPMAMSSCAGIIGANGVAPVRIENGLLVNLDGMTLYVFDRDRAAGPGKSVCLGQCAANWPPLTAAEDAHPHADYGIIAREDGRRQWTHKGRPLYLWTKDGKPGDRTGDDLNKVWHVVKP